MALRGVDLFEDRRFAIRELLSHRTELALSHQMKLHSSQLSGLQRRLEALNPLAILQRGYAVVSKPDGSLVRSATQVQPGDELNVRVSDGEFPAQVSESK